MTVERQLVTLKCPRCGRERTIPDPLLRHKSRRPKSPLCQPCAASLVFLRLGTPRRFRIDEEER